MKSVLRLVAGLSLLLPAAGAFAHGDEKHGEEEMRPVAGEVGQAHPGHGMGTLRIDAASRKTLEDHDDEQVQSERIAGTLKSLHPATVHFPIALATSVPAPAISESATSPATEESVAASSPKPVPSRAPTPSARKTAPAPVATPAPPPAATPVADPHAGHDISTMSDEEMKAMGHNG